MWHECEGVVGGGMGRRGVGLVGLDRWWYEGCECMLVVGMYGGRG